MSKALYKADCTFKAPFQLAVTESKELLICTEVIRVIPAKRMVVFGMWGDKEVVVKLFYGRKNKYRCLRDLQGIEILAQANVPTPKLLFNGSADKKRIHLLIFEKINDAINLSACWEENRNSPELKELLHAVTIEIATQHVLGIMQQDLYLKNFLITEKCIYTLDGAQIKKFENPLSKKLSLNYLSLFLVQFGVGTEELQRELFEVYAKSRGWIIKKADVNRLESLLIRREKKRWLHYQKKIVRNCTSFKKLDSFGRSIMYDRQYHSEQFLKFLQNPEPFFLNSSATILKKGHSSTVIKVEIDNHCLVIKRYNIKNSWHWLRRCLRTTRAAKSWRLAHRLRSAGLLTAKPVATIENHCLGLAGKSYFVMEYVAGEHSGDFFSTAPADHQYVQAIAESVLRFIKNLASMRILHGDLKNTNILVHHNQTLLIDLDGMHEYNLSWNFNKAYRKELKRFMQNWENDPSVFALFENLLKKLNMQHELS